MKSIKMVFFDMDGSLIDSEFMYINAWHDLFQKHDIPIRFEEILTWRGKNNLLINERINQYLDNMDATLNLRSLRDEIFNKKLMNGEVKLRPYALEILDYCDSKGIPYALVTSTYREKASRLLTYFNLMDRFQFVLFGDEVKESKPAPDIYLKALELSGYKKEDIVIFEDSKNGIESGINADLDVIYVVDREKIDVSGLKLFSTVSDFKEGIELLSRYID